MLSALRKIEDTTMRIGTNAQTVLSLQPTPTDQTPPSTAHSILCMVDIHICLLKSKSMWSMSIKTAQKLKTWQGRNLRGCPPESRGKMTAMTGALSPKVQGNIERAQVKQSSST